MKTKHNYRVLKLVIISEAFTYFCRLEIHRRLLKDKGDYREAETVSDMVNVILTNRKTTAADFMVNEEDNVNEMIETYKKYSKSLDLYEMATGETRVELDHFCKALYHTAQRHFPEENFSFNHQMMVTLKYINDQVTKEEYARLMVDYDLNGPKPVNLCWMRRQIRTFENMLSSIIEKRDIRKGNRLEDNVVYVWP